MRYSQILLQQDFCLLIVFCALPAIIGVALNLSGLVSQPNYAMISVEGMCCRHRAHQAVSSVERVPGVSHARATVPNQTIHVELKGAHLTSPQSIWEAVEAVGLRPTQLNIKHESFRTKPAR